jgi:hypothetical protein
MPESDNFTFDKYFGEFILVLDRSPSMNKLSETIDALILFLQSLPQKSLFNIISIGSTISKMYTNSISYTD